MCGIVGLMTKNFAVNQQHIKLLTHLLLLDQLRGEHATGLAKINPTTGEAKVHKMACDAIEYLNDKETYDFIDRERQRIYIGHNRFATMGARDDAKNAHPFQCDHITGVHNGTVDRWTMKKLEGFNDPKITVDSHMVYETIAKKGIAEALPLLSGAFSLVWWDSKQRSLNFLRNEKRPMTIAHLKDGTMVWASEPEFIKVIVERDKLMEIETIYSTATNSHIRWEFSEQGTLLHDGKPVITEMKFKDIPDPNPAPVYQGGYYGGGRRPSWGEQFNNYHGNRQTQRVETVKSADGCDLGTEASIIRSNTLLQTAKTHYRMGDRAFLDFEDFTPYNGRRSDEGTLFLSIRTLNGNKLIARVFNIKEASIRDENGEYYQNFRGTITNVFEQHTTIGRVTKLFTMISLGNVVRTNFNPNTVDKSSSTEVAADEKKPSSRSIVSFPLKVHGHTFATRQEFIDLTSIGCYCCGVIPNIFDHRNSDIAVINNGEDYICGACVQEDWTEQVGNCK